jgi:hypothetical protein
MSTETFGRLVSLMEQTERIEAEIKELVKPSRHCSFDCDDKEIRLQAHTHKSARDVRKLFPAAKWEKRWVGNDCNWFEWTASIGEYTVSIYAIKDTPPTCKQVFETRLVDVPVAFEQEVQEVLIGWDCGGEIIEVK